MSKQIAVSIAAFIRVLWLITAGIVGLDLLATAFALLTGHDHVFGLLGVLDLDKERGVGVIFQVNLLLLSSALWFWAASHARSGLVMPGPWALLGWIFAFLALDEFAYLHERLMPAMRQLVGSEGVLHFAWIVPYGIGVVVLALWVGPRVLRLPPGPRGLLIWAAIAYVGGALGMEALGGWQLTRIGGEAARPELIYESMTTVEETLEMVGLILLIRGLLEWLEPHILDREIRVLR